LKYIDSVDTQIIPNDPRYEGKNNHQLVFKRTDGTTAA